MPARLPTSVPMTVPALMPDVRTTYIVRTSEICTVHSNTPLKPTLLTTWIAQRMHINHQLNLVLCLKPKAIIHLANNE